ncbi:MAG: acyl carrier protein [Burkholderiales bacterium]
MSPDDLRPRVLAELLKIAPELDEGELRPGEPLRDQVDLDSMDWLNFLIALHARFGVEIPESDYAGLDTLERICAYLAARIPKPS